MLYFMGGPRVVSFLQNIPAGYTLHPSQPPIQRIPISLTIRLQQVSMLKMSEGITPLPPCGPLS
jgi:hypothetical protein